MTETVKPLTLADAVYQAAVKQLQDERTGITMRLVPAFTPSVASVTSFETVVPSFWLERFTGDKLCDMGVSVVSTTITPPRASQPPPASR